MATDKSPVDIISCLSDDEDEVNDDGKPNGGDVASGGNVGNLKRKKGSIEGSDGNVSGKDAAPRKVSLDPPEGGGLKPALTDEDEDDDEIEVMDVESYRLQVQAAAAATVASSGGNAGGEGNGASKSTDNDEEELEIVGTHNEQRLPHNRQNCLDFRFCASNPNGKSGSGGSQADNSKFCSLCYCYVCDKPASECDNWVNGTKGVCSDSSAASDGGGKRGNANADSTKPHRNHCNATDMGSHSTLWKNMRNAVKKGKDPSTVSATRDESYNANAPNASLQQYLQNYGVYMPPGGGSIRRSDQHYQVSAANHLNHANAYAAAMLQVAMNHALSRGPPPLGTTAPPARSSRGGRSRSYTIHSGSAAAAAMSAAVAAAMSSGAPTAPARSASRGRSRNTLATAAMAAAARASTRSARRNRPEQSEESGNKRAAPHDHQARIRTQQMLEDLYG